MNRPLRILTWHVHGNYLFYLVQTPHDFYLPVKPGRPEGYGGKLPGFAWPGNVHEIDAQEVKSLDLDCILFQSRKNYTEDQYELLTPEQQRLPRLYLEHDPPQEHPTNTAHVVQDAAVTVVHVTHFNRLMWDNGERPVRVIEHGVLIPDVEQTGELSRAVAVVNGLPTRGRRLGRDVYLQVRQQAPVDLVGMGSEELGGLGEVPHEQLPAFIARYRVFFNPIRYTSLGLSICEAMMAGLPVVGLATTELVTVVEQGISGYLETDVDRLALRVRELVDDPQRARAMGARSRTTALRRFNITRFVEDWDRVFREAVEPETKQSLTALAGVRPLTTNQEARS